MQPERELDELPEVPPTLDGTYDHRHESAPYMPTAIDVFEKVRGHERAEQLRAAREADLLPYFRRLESPAAPVVATGGLAELVATHSSTIGQVDPFLTLDGLRMVWELNA